MRYLLISIFPLGVLISSTVYAHPGLVDSYGCHPNVVHGSYHCHREPLADRQFKSKEEMLRVRQELEQDNRVKEKPQPPGRRF